MASLFSSVRMGHSMAPSVSSILPPTYLHAEASSENASTSHVGSTHSRSSSSTTSRSPSSSSFVPIVPSWPPSASASEPPPPFPADASSRGPSGQQPHVYPPTAADALPTLPPYIEDVEDPSPPYDRINRHPDTLARHFFQLGFLCPLLWLLNIIILFSPLTVMPEDEGPADRCKTPDERREELAIMRDIELRWARKSAIAFGVLCAAVALTCILVFAVRWPSGGTS